MKKKLMAVSVLKADQSSKPSKVSDAIREKGLSFHLFVDSAEGIRAPIDRTVASRRADRAMEKLAHPA